MRTPGHLVMVLNYLLVQNQPGKSGHLYNRPASNMPAYSKKNNRLECYASIMLAY